MNCRFSPLCATPDFDVALMVMPYFSWLLKSNGKHQVIKFLLLSKRLYLTFYVPLKDGGTIWGLSLML